MTKGRQTDNDAATRTDVARAAALDDPFRRKGNADYIARIAKSEASLARRNNRHAKADEYDLIAAEAAAVHQQAMRELAEATQRLADSLIAPMDELPPAGVAPVVDFLEEAGPGVVDLTKTIAVLTVAHDLYQDPPDRAKVQRELRTAAADLAAEYREILDQRMSLISGEWTAERERAEEAVALAREVEDRLRSLALFREFAAAALYQQSGGPGGTITWDKAGEIAGFTKMQVFTLRRRYKDTSAPAIIHPEALARVLRIEHEVLSEYQDRIVQLRDSAVAGAAHAEAAQQLTEIAAAVTTQAVEEGYSPYKGLPREFPLDDPARPVAVVLSRLERRDGSEKGRVGTLLTRAIKIHLDELTDERRMAGFALRDQGWTWEAVREVMQMNATRLKTIRLLGQPAGPAPDHVVQGAEARVRIDTVKIGLVRPVHKKACEVRDRGIVAMFAAGWEYRDIVDHTGRGFGEGFLKNWSAQIAQIKTKGAPIDAESATA